MVHSQTPLNIISQRPAEVDSIIVGSDLNVTHLSFSSSGGAGRVALRLCESQQMLGVKVQTRFSTSGDVRSLALKDPVLFGKALADFYGVRKSVHSPLFSLLRVGNSLFTETSGSHDHILHFHWMPGVVDLADVATKSAKFGGIVWTLHDMWPFTGGCHHSLDCNQFTESCESCPQSRRRFHTRIRESLRRKERAVEQLARFAVVAPSDWIAQQAAKSRVLRSIPIHLIHNPVAAEFFGPQQRSKRAQLCISDEAVVFGLVAANPNDPIKGVSRTLRLLSELAIRLPDQEIVVLLVGSKTKVNAAGNMRVVSTGYLVSSKEVAGALGLVDVFVSLSEVETAPLAVAEALAQGLPVICNSAGGLVEYVDNGRNGVLIKSDTEFLAAAEHLAVSPQTRAEMSSRAKMFAKDRFEPQEVASKYLAIYANLLASVSKET